MQNREVAGSNCAGETERLNFIFTPAEPGTKQRERGRWENPKKSKHRGGRKQKGHEILYLPSINHQLGCEWNARACPVEAT
jgi:hypothetical protein